ncbi:phosphatase [Geomonas sp. RF6]|uniref:phosphatase n=1 Tax=Geomonas sp. RF6 TaxID=2897342 RepID=UPI001E436EBC|nr:phosphatase [Geomonas sp. RF6]UFS72308.1 phosphatase [Geomonas sp. RF6]
MKIIADLHTHTVASGHGYSTVNELAQAAAEKGLQALAVTDHGPAMPGGPHRYHFMAMRFIPRSIAGVRILRGVEANIQDVQGGLDLEDEILESLDFVMVGLHERCGYEEGGMARNTEAVLAAMENPRVRCISHPGNLLYPLDYEAIVRGAVATGTALELNNSSLGPSRKGSCMNCREIARLCARHGAPLLIGSDAHIAQGVGIFDDAVQMAVEEGVQESQVMNASLERLLVFLGLEG